MTDSETETPSVRVCFAYQHEYRVVDATSVTRTKSGHWLITGRDVDKGEFRSFRVDRIQNTLRFLP